jgi:hypothetical protein
LHAVIIEKSPAGIESPRTDIIDAGLGGDVS